MDDSSFINRVDGDGSILFADDGIEVAVMSGRERFNTGLATLPGIDDVYVYWRETDSDQNNSGIYGQRFSQTGERQWTDFGKSLISLAPREIVPFEVNGSSQGTMILFADGQSAVITYIRAMLVDEEGDPVWLQNSISMSENESQKLHEVGSVYSNQQWLAVWEDRRTDDGDIFAQNISDTGQLGPVQGSGSDNNIVEQTGIKLSNFPNPFNPSTMIAFNLGVESDVKLDIYNVRGEYVKTIVNDKLAAGNHQFEWNGTNSKGRQVTSGTYLVHMQHDSGGTTHKIVLLK